MGTPGRRRKAAATTREALFADSEWATTLNPGAWVARLNYGAVGRDALLLGLRLGLGGLVLVEKAAVGPPHSK